MNKDIDTEGARMTIQARKRQQARKFLVNSVGVFALLLVTFVGLDISQAAQERQRILTPEYQQKERQRTEPAREELSRLQAERAKREVDATAAPREAGWLGARVCQARSGVFLGQVVVDIDGQQSSGVPSRVDGDGMWSGSTVVVKRDGEYARLPLATITRC